MRQQDRLSCGQQLDNPQFGSGDIHNDFPSTGGCSLEQMPPYELSIALCLQYLGSRDDHVVWERQSHGKQRHWVTQTMGLADENINSP
jgi:hypothetical protein